MADISRADALALINQQNSDEIWQEAAQTSVALSTFRRVTMSAKQKRMPVLDVLPTSGFLATDTTAKPTSEMVWANKMLEAEPIGVIIPIPEDVFDDSSFNIWNEIRPRIAEAVGTVLDGAVLFGTNKPTSWPNSLEDGARAAGNVYSKASAGDLAEDLNQVIGLVEADGYDPNIAYAPRKLRVSLRGLRDSNGMPIYTASLAAGSPASAIYGIDLQWVRNGSWQDATAGTPNTGADAIVGDRTKAILGVRKDLTFKILDQATVGTFNLAEQDMIALRAVIRVGFQVADPTTIEGGSGAYPFAILDV